MAQGWLEPRTRVPFAGIVAIVVIVAVVAVFLRAGLEDILPESEVHVQGAKSTDNIRGSATFSGSRQTHLSFAEVLQGVLVTNEGSVGLSINLKDKLLIMEQQGLREEVFLSLTRDGLGLTATFEQNGQQTTFTVFPAEREAIWQQAGGLGVTTQLIDSTIYTGEFLFNGVTYEVTVNPGVPNVVVDGDMTYVVPLSSAGSLLTGTWRTDDADHPLEINLKSMKFEVMNLW